MKNSKRKNDRHNVTLEALIVLLKRHSIDKAMGRNKGDKDVLLEMSEYKSLDEKGKNLVEKHLVGSDYEAVRVAIVGAIKES